MGKIAATALDFHCMCSYNGCVSVPPGNAVKIAIKKRVMETLKLGEKKPQLLLKCYDTLIRWFFIHINIEGYHKIVMETLFLRLHASRHDVQNGALCLDIGGDKESNRKI